MVYGDKYNTSLKRNVRFCLLMSGNVRICPPKLILLVCFRWRRYHICTPLVKFFRDYFWVFFEKFRWCTASGLCAFLWQIYNAENAKSSVLGNFLWKKINPYLVQYVSTKNIILRFMLGSQVCGPQVCEPILIHWILINYHYKKVIFNTKTKTSMKKICFACWTNFPENRSERKTNRRNSSSKIRNVWRRIRKSCWNVKAFFYFAKAYFYFAKAKILFAKAQLKSWFNPQFPPS